jgi:hypothetical protein
MTKAAVVLHENEPSAVIPLSAPTPMTMLARAVEQGADLDKLTKLMDLQERWEANEARKAFVAALNAFKADPPTLTKNKHVMFETSRGVTEYDHATLDQVSSTIGKALSAHGLSHRWEVEQLEGGLIKVTCVLTHDKGHSERVPMQCTADDSGGKNKIQSIGSTVTYLQRYTLLAATGMAVGGADNDGRGAEETGLSAEQLATFEKNIKDATSAADLAGKWKEIAKACKDAKDKGAYDDLKGKVSVRGAEFKEAK